MKWLAPSDGYVMLTLQPNPIATSCSYPMCPNKADTNDHRWHYNNQQIVHQCTMIFNTLYSASRYNISRFHQWWEWHMQSFKVSWKHQLATTSYAHSRGLVFRHTEFNTYTIHISIKWCISKNQWPCSPLDKTKPNTSTYIMIWTQVNECHYDHNHVLTTHIHTHITSDSEEEKSTL